MKVLIAEDDPVTQTVLSGLVEAMGYSSIIADNGQSALDSLHNQHDIGLALIDWMLPGIHGPELCQSIKSTQSFIYIIMVTGKTQTEDLVLAIEAGADDFVTKPFNSEELKARIHAGLRMVHHDRRIAKHANYDELTGVWNRRMVMNFLENEWWRAHREHKRLSLMMIDMDHFKQVNDKHGHHSGDLVLIQFAQIISSSIRPYDQLGRYGGEEFVLVMPLSDNADALKLAERIRESVASHSFIIGNSSPLTLTVSIGLAEKSDDDVSPNDTLKRADLAVYRAKKKGRNCVVSDKESGAP
ncbi:MAG: diguanylate cyclase [Oleiphilaceae bacterium]|nr:diguanylate cyclase [Oleiphilaceae bacterium]